MEKNKKNKEVIITLCKYLLSTLDPKEPSSNTYKGLRVAPRNFPTYPMWDVTSSTQLLPDDEGTRSSVIHFSFHFW